MSILNFKYVNIGCAIAFCGLIAASSIYKIPFCFYGILMLVWLMFTIIGSFKIGWNYHFKSLNFNANTTENQISITFDDGPTPEFTLPTLDLLEKYNAKATFFCIGKHITAHPEILNRIVKSGHTIGNHTFSHSNFFGFFNTKDVVRELERTNLLVKDQIGLNMKLFRPAFGVTNPSIKRALFATGLYSVGWNKRSLDTTKLSDKAIFNRITKNLKKGDVILLHDTSLKSIRVLEQLLVFLKSKNIKSVPVDILFNIDAYE